MSRRYLHGVQRRLFVKLAVLGLILGAIAVVAFRNAGERTSATQGVPSDIGRNPHPIAGKFRPDQTRLSDCGSEFPCLEQAFGNLSFHEGPKVAMRMFDDAMRSDRAVEADCHRIAHSIGSGALARFEGNVARAFATGSSSCWSGYYHGILERAFVDASARRLAPVARRLCEDELVRGTQYLAYQCVHGLGHGLMIFTGYDLPRSLAVCDRLATAWDQSSCTGGVFMENLSSSYGFRSPWLKDDDLEYPCNAVRTRHRYYCYLMVTSRVLQANGYDWKATSDLCRAVEPRWVRLCFQSFGRDASGFTRQNAAGIVRLCRVAGHYEGECIYGAARDITSNDAGAIRSRRLCEGASPQMRARCFEGIGTILGTVHGPQRRRAVCARTTERYLRSCLRGAGVVG